MPEFSRMLDTPWQTSPLPEPTGAVGYVLSLTVGDVVLEADQRVRWPDAAGDERPVVAVLTHVQWSMGVTDPLRLIGLLSPANQRRCLALDGSAVPVAVDFSVWEVRAADGGVFRSLGPAGDGPLRALLEVHGTRSGLEVGPEPEVGLLPTPGELHRFSLCLSPVVSQQVMRLALSQTLHVDRAWGLATP